MTPTDLFPQHRTWVPVNLSDHADRIKQSRTWRLELEAELGGKLYGGFMEDRSPVFDSRHISERCIHVGVDFWVKSGTAVCFPRSCTVVHASSDAGDHGGWGGRIDLRTDDGLIWILGHMEEPAVKVGDRLERGRGWRYVGLVAHRSRNGGWQPHLHVQVVTEAAYNKFSKKRELDAYCEIKDAILTSFRDPLYTP